LNSDERNAGMVSSDAAPALYSVARPPRDSTGPRAKGKDEPPL